MIVLNATELYTLKWFMVNSMLREFYLNFKKVCIEDFITQMVMYFSPIPAVRVDILTP